MKGIHDPAAVEACLRACRFGKVLEAQRTELFLLEHERENWSCLLYTSDAADD